MKSVSKVLMALALLAVIGVGGAGCAKKPRGAQAAMDTPEHHVYTGERKLAAGELDEAEKAFNLALELNPKYAPAFVGRGLVQAGRKNWKAAHEDLDKAVSEADNDEDEMAAYVGMVRLVSEERAEEDWLDDAENYYDKAVDADEDAPEPHYYMGIALKRAFKFEEAGEMFRRVLDMNTEKEGTVSAEMMSDATAEWRLVQDIQLAAPGSKIGKQIALIDKISRADLAALFIQELDLPKLYRKRGKKFDTSFKSPEKKMEADRISKMAAAVDIAEHVLRQDIEEAIKLGIRGLEPDPEHKFHPDEPVTKAEFAVILEDVLTKITGDTELSTKFIGETSPFPDVRSDAPYFNAVMVTSSRQVLGAKDLSTGEFAPKDPVSGALALLSIRKLKDALQY